MKIVGTEKIRGVLDLSQIGVQMSPGTSYYITSDQRSHFQVHQAIKMGYLTVEMDDDNEFAPTLIELKNKHPKTVIVSCLNVTIAPGQKFTVTEDQLARPEIQGAIAKGMFEVAHSSENQTEVQEYTMRVGPLLKEVVDEDDGHNSISMTEETTSDDTNTHVIVDNKPSAQTTISKSVKTVQDDAVWDGTSHPVIKPGVKKKPIGRPRKQSKAKELSQEMSDTIDKIQTATNIKINDVAPNNTEVSLSDT